jgi:cell division septation protein DedD
MSDPGSIRNLEQLQEDDEDRRMPRGVTMLLVALGGACVVFAGVALGGRTSQPPVAKLDPLGDLVSQRSRVVPIATASARAAMDLSPRDVTFPQMLSDDSRPPTALAAVRPVSSAPPAAPPVPVPTQPPPPTDRLPVVPLPAQAVLEASPIVTRPRDALTKVASDAAQIDTPPSPSGGDAAAPAGHAGGYQLQVSSFRTQAEAQAFADQLRARGHKAYTVEAQVPGRGTWFRVRIGPFQTQHAASQYRTGFEAREHVVPFIVPPETAARPH